MLKSTGRLKLSVSSFLDKICYKMNILNDVVKVFNNHISRYKSANEFL